ncbi:uncharacterized protein K452DRAFT_290721 [Aplosporella prunicola CBS 121167]|uniref:Phosphotyrosine protein phosphatase I domain-containing protein n=1 Tax=Aplosporella prunicola CBS 121167 TaxID=1176127 RepID=A0A6A6B591_9PEZI|nr:uncharacterized protein K452DRAFT_290721 [Aplosporella prunicola CBS 121167]KAF2138583.1 hypothetical protein K452DRAFT_290721 [Aplosporella prunicola CBS 121167]
MASDASTPKPVNVLFVCLGNICRSTMAEGVFRHVTNNANPLVGAIDSCGTGAYHVGSNPDSRTMSTLQDHGIKTYRHKARKFAYPGDFDTFDYIMAMDDENLADLVQLRKRYARELESKGRKDEVAHLGRVMLFGEFGGRRGEVVDDPYYGGRDGFEIAYAQMIRFTDGFLKHLSERPREE